MDIIAEIRRRHFVSKENISSIARSLGLSRPTVRKHLKTEVEPKYRRQTQYAPKLGEFKTLLTKWLETETLLPKKQRRTAMRLYEGLVAEGYAGAYDSVRRFVKQWKAENKDMPAPQQAFVPLAFKPGEVCQFDWSQEVVELGGLEQIVKVAHFRLCYSRKMFVVAYFREAQEMLMDAHNRAFAFFGGVPLQMVYDNPKTIVDTILIGKERKFNRRFMALASHYLFEPVACTPAAGWEKGQIENQVGNVREWLFTPRVKFGTLDGLNRWLAQRCHELSNRRHPDFAQTIAECFQQEQSLLRQITTPFAGYVEHLMKVSRTCLVRVDRNQYSVPAQWSGQVVSVRVFADRLDIVSEGRTIATHQRSFLRDQLICDPWHYLPLLEKKPGAIRHGAPFQNWELPEAIRHVREKLRKQDKNERAFVDLLLLTREAGLEALETACELALESGVVNASVLQNAIRRLIEPVRPKALNTGDTLQLTTEPRADFQRYDHLLGSRHVH
ncbi:MAG: IS21 family transposase [Burkholderiales bacterium]|nr:IS21 family transposase [Burkholderiales bacterium]